MSSAHSRAIDPQVRIGHVHLKVADLERALAFYCGVLGFELMQRYGTQGAFVSAGGYHHHIGLNTWESLGGSPPPPGSTGLYHTAILYPTRAALADALRRLIAAGITLDGASDHGVSEALYLRDPDENGVELYWDRPPELWPRTPAGELAMFTRSLDLDELLRQIPQLEFVSPDSVQRAAAACGQRSSEGRAAEIVAARRGRLNEVKLVFETEAPAGSLKSPQKDAGGNERDNPT